MTSLRVELSRLAPLYLVVFIAFCGYSLIVTLFTPMLMSNIGFLPDGASVGLRTTLIGVLLAIYPLGQFVGAPIIGALSDRHGRRPVLLTSLCISVLAFVAITVGVKIRSLALLSAGCLIGGLAESNIAIVQSTVADIAAPDERPRLFAWIYSASSVGYIVGPVAGGLLATRIGWSMPFVIVTALLALTTAWVYAAFAETHRGSPDRPVEYLASLTAIASVVRDRRIRPLYLVNFLFYFALFGYFRVILIYMADAWHLPVAQSTSMYAALAGASLFGSFVLMAPATRWFGLVPVAVAAAIIAGGAMIAIVVLPNESLWWATTAPASMIGTLTLSACATILANAVGEEEQGRVMGNNQALQVGAEAVSAAAGGAVAAISTGLPLVLFGALLVAAGLLLWKWSGVPAAAAVASPSH